MPLLLASNKGVVSRIEFLMMRKTPPGYVPDRRPKYDTIKSNLGFALIAVYSCVIYRKYTNGDDATTVVVLF